MFSWVWVTVSDPLHYNTFKAYFQTLLLQMPFLWNFYELIMILPQLIQRKNTTRFLINGSSYHLVCIKFSFQFCLKLGNFHFYNDDFKEKSMDSCPLQLIAVEVYILTRILYHMNNNIFHFLTLFIKLSADMECLRQEVVKL